MNKILQIEECRLAMETMRSYLQSQHDHAEIYDPPRVVKEANGMGMRGGSFLDFTAPGPDMYRMPSKGSCQDQGDQVLYDGWISRVHPVSGHPEPEDADARGRG